MLLSRLAYSAVFAVSLSSSAFAADATPAPAKAAAPAKPAEAKPAAKVAAKPAPAKPAAKATSVVEEHLTAALLLSRADAAMAKGDTDTALQLGQAAIVQESTNPGPYVALGNLYVRANRAEFARGFYDQALNLDPQNVDAKAAAARLETMPQAQLPANGG